MSASERRLAELEDENRKLREQIVRVAGGADELGMESGVNRKLEGFVTVRWGAEVGQLTPDDARRHGLAMLECAEAAESDAAVMRGIRAGGFDDDVGFGLVRLIREHRGPGNASAE